MLLRMLSSTSLHVGPTLLEGKGGVLASPPVVPWRVQALSSVHSSTQMPFGGVTVKDVDSHEFVLALASYFKKQMV